MIFFTYLGDLLSRPLLECLVKIAELYGEHFILIQYMPYCWDLAGLCKRKVSQNLEGGLLGSLAVLHAIIPLLSDSVLMKVSIIKNQVYILNGYGYFVRELFVVSGLPTCSSILCP